MSNDQPYGIGPCMINDLPLLKAENERRRLQNLLNEQQDVINAHFREAAMAIAGFNEHDRKSLIGAFDIGRAPGTGGD